MTDRDLLEAAAKAAELAITWGEVYMVGGDAVDCTDLPYIKSDDREELDRYWNPLEDDGDAFRLLVRLGLFWSPEFAHYLSLERFSAQDKDDCYAHRRAIVRAAAAIGKDMP